MNIERRFILFQVFLCVIFFQNIGLAQEPQKDVLQTFIQREKVLDRLLSNTLSNLVTVYKIPVSFERELSDSPDIPNNAQGSPDFKDLSLKDFLDELVRLNPKYKWTYIDGIIRVFPVSDEDKVLTEILDTNVNFINITENNCEGSLGSLIFSDVNVKIKAQSLNVKGFHLCNSNLLSKFNKGVSYNRIFSGVKVRDILNQIIKESSYKYWTILRWGKDKNLVTIATY